MVRAIPWPCAGGRWRRATAARWPFCCGHSRRTTLPTPRPAGWWALLLPPRRSVTNWARRVLPFTSLAIAAVRPRHGFWKGDRPMSASSSPRMLSLWLPRFATDRIRRLRDSSSFRGANAVREPGIQKQLLSPHRDSGSGAERYPGMTAMNMGKGEEIPLIVAGRRGNADVLIAIDENAARHGLSPGLALAQARAMHPSLDVVPEDASADAELLESIADWCLRYTPLVACDAPDGLLLDISGCAHLYGGERQLVADLGQRLAQAGFAYRSAIAGTIGAAFAAARDGRPDAYANGEERDILCPLPLGALRLPPPMVASLGRVGLKCIGDIIDMPRAPLAAR